MFVPGGDLTPGDHKGDGACGKRGGIELTGSRRQISPFAPRFGPERRMVSIRALRKGKLFMLQQFPSLSRFYSKLFYELLPAAIASAVGGMIFNHYAKMPVAVPQAAVAAPASAEMIQMARDEHALFVNI
jgi:hypothetical protein